MRTARQDRGSVVQTLIRREVPLQVGARQQRVGAGSYGFCCILLLIGIVVLNFGLIWTPTVQAGTPPPYIVCDSPFGAAVDAEDLFPDGNCVLVCKKWDALCKASASGTKSCNKKEVNKWAAMEIAVCDGDAAGIEDWKGIKAFNLNSFENNFALAKERCMDAAGTDCLTDCLNP